MYHATKHKVMYHVTKHKVMYHVTKHKVMYHVTKHKVMYHVTNHKATVRIPKLNSNQNTKNSKVYVVRAMHFGMKLYNDQRNAQVFNLFTYLLLPYVFWAFFWPIFRGRCTNSAMVQVSRVWCQRPGADTMGLKKARNMAEVNRYIN
jgi:hypothetical protein